MAKVKIFRKDGTPTPYFWSDKEGTGTDRTQQTVYKQTTAGVKRMTGVHFNALTKQMQKD